MRCVLVLLLLAVTAAAGDPPLTPEQKADVVRIVGKRAWGSLPPWHQGKILKQYAAFLRLPKAKQAEIRRGDLRQYLLPQLPRDAKQHRLPVALRAEVDGLAPDVQPLAAKLAYMRLRQLRLDRSLHRLPFEQRWPLFRRLFPEPFDPREAKPAHHELRKKVAKSIAAEVRARMQAEGLDPEQHKKRLVRKAIAEEERQVVERIRKEIFRFQRADPKRVRQLLERRGFWLLERGSFATPRQAELIRYAFRPHECPLLDLRWLGPRPDEPAEERRWERDYRVFARLELLSKAGFPREMVLYLAGTGSPEDFLTAVKRLRQHPARGRKRNRSGK
ncbi:MAG: hypothetical protein ACYTF8_14440 [Planctomycetota bacterium]|jgi:hypothetical protein